MDEGLRVPTGTEIQTNMIHLRGHLGVIWESFGSSAGCQDLGAGIRDPGAGFGGMEWDGARLEHVGAAHRIL